MGRNPVLRQRAVLPARPAALRAGLADRLAEILALDGRGRLLDVGCGPGVLTLVLSPFFAEAVGVDPDAGHAGGSRTPGRSAGMDNVRWVGRGPRTCRPASAPST